MVSNPAHMNLRLDGKRALVCSASQGIGASAFLTSTVGYIAGINSPVDGGPLQSP